MRTELEVCSPDQSPPRFLTQWFLCAQTRMVHSKPYELLLPEEKLSKASEKMITHFTQYDCYYSSLTQRPITLHHLLGSRLQTGPIPTTRYAQSVSSIVCPIPKHSPISPRSTRISLSPGSLPKVITRVCWPVSTYRCTGSLTEDACWVNRGTHGSHL